MKRLPMSPVLVALLLSAVSLGCGFLSWTPWASPSGAQASTPVDIAIDMDVTGNDARLNGGADIQNCGEITGTGTLQIDVIIPPPGVDAADGIRSYLFNLNYNPAVVKVTAEAQNFLLAQAPGSNLFSLSDPLPDTDGSFLSAATDIGSPPDPEPTGISEVGPGVIARITLTGVALGTTPLTLTTIIPVAADNSQIPINSVSIATVSVDEPCVFTTPTPTPTPAPTPTPTPTPPPGAGPTFNPATTCSVSDPTPGANADMTQTFSIPRGDLQFGSLMFFTPPAWGIATDADIPNGAIVAHVSAIATLGLLGDGCANRLALEFDMMDATTMGTTVPFYDPEQEFNPPDRSDSQGSEPDDQFDIGPGGLPLGVTRYPNYLTRIFKGPGGTVLQPIARYYGQTEVAGIEVSLNFVLFEPGIVYETPAGDEITTDPRLGYPSVTVLQAGGDPDTEADIEGNNTVSDFCSPLEASTTVFGISRDNPDTTANEGGLTVRANPPDGAYNFVTYAVSQYDADDDGIENGLDVCPFTPNPNWNPRLRTSDPAYTGDQDKDGLPDECDPAPAMPSPISGGVRDEDRDLYGNRADNCPLWANSGGQLGGSGLPNQQDSDADGIGDACDPNPTVPDGHNHSTCLVSPIDIGGGGPPSYAAPQNLQPCYSGSGAGGVGGIVELRAEPQAQSDQPASTDPLPIGASVALGVLVLGGAGLYAVKLRRG
jgi:hypothetical protein